MGTDGDDKPKRPLQGFLSAAWRIIDGPTTFVREKIVVPIQSRNPYPYYHQKFRRVKDIDECEEDDLICFVEANLQYKRDKLVDMQVLKILRQRKIECYAWEGDFDRKVKCKTIIEEYEKASTNYFIKYGDMGATHDVRSAYMKQKHRMVWERRHGKVGMGRDAKDKPEPPVDWTHKDFPIQ